MVRGAWLRYQRRTGPRAVTHCPQSGHVVLAGGGPAFGLGPGVEASITSLAIAAAAADAAVRVAGRSDADRGAADRGAGSHGSGQIAGLALAGAWQVAAITIDAVSADALIIATARLARRQRRLANAGRAEVTGDAILIDKAIALALGWAANVWIAGLGNDRWTGAPITGGR